MNKVYNINLTTRASHGFVKTSGKPGELLKTQGYQMNTSTVPGEKSVK